MAFLKSEVLISVGRVIGLLQQEIISPFCDSAYFVVESDVLIPLISERPKIFVFSSNGELVQISS